MVFKKIFGCVKKNDENPLKPTVKQVRKERSTKLRFDLLSTEDLEKETKDEMDFFQEIIDRLTREIEEAKKATGIDYEIVYAKQYISPYDKYK
ncbi:hypothetical protein LJC41_01300 [Desulfosarcina sp. OttesenSCG-928-G17]|nr:hypothetical protein [Desulfosarcina sp. OttesenSCG-928-G17]